MKFETLAVDGVEFDEVEAADLRVRISRQGAEMVSLARRGANGWRGVLHRDGETSLPASGWGNHATVMGYFLHRLWHEQSTYRGSLIRGGNHGFLRHFSFAAPRHIADGLVYTVCPDEVPADAYPLRVGLELSYRIVGEAVRVEFAFTNEEAALSAHVSFGLHPGFAISSMSEARVIFPPGRYVRFFAPGNFLNGETETLEFGGGEMPYAKSELGGSYLLGLDGVPDRTFAVESNGARVSLDFSEVPFATIWSEGDDFVCVEPCWGLPDSNPPVPFEEKIGIQVIAPGETIRRGFTIRPEFLP